MRKMLRFRLLSPASAAPRLACAALVASCILLAATTGAAAAKKQPTAPPEPQPESPPAHVVLRVVIPNGSTTWALRVDNTGDVPVRLVADARFLALDVTGPGDRAKVHCRLPDDMRPHDPEERAIVLPPKRAFVERFEPQLYCFNEREAAALATGATVVAHLGWAPHVVTKKGETRPTNGPNVLLSAGGNAPRVRSEHELVSAPFVIPAPSEVTAESSSPPSSSAGRAPAKAAPVVAEEAFPPLLALSAPARVDAIQREDVRALITAANEGERPVDVLLRPSTISLEVTTPRTYVLRCQTPLGGNGHIRENYVRLAPKARAQVPMVLSSACSPSTFAEAGLYRVVPVLDTRRSEAPPPGMRPFIGESRAPRAILVRLHQGRVKQAPRRPTLEAALDGEP